MIYITQFTLAATKLADKIINPTQHIQSKQAETERLRKLHPDERRSQNMAKLYRRMS